MEMYAFKNITINYSSSGGAFPTMLEALQFMYANKKIIVYGAAVDDSVSVRHIRCENKVDWMLLSGSKYVESLWGGDAKCCNRPF